MSAKSNSNGNGNAGATVVQVVSGSAGAPGRTIQVRARVKMIGAYSATRQVSKYLKLTSKKELPLHHIVVSLLSFMPQPFRDSKFIVNRMPSLN